MHITAVILAKNEEKKVERAIHSVSFCDEVLVVNDFSTDKTATLAQSLGARVLDFAVGQNFAHARNYAMEQAQNEWVLFLDADEVVSTALAHEISTYFQSPDDLAKTGLTAFKIPRRDFFWGAELKHGEIAEARMHGIIRLVKKGTGTWIGRVHEVFARFGPLKKLSGFIDHYPHDTVSAFIHDINLYSSLRAEELYESQRTVSAWEMVFVPFAKFFYTYVILLGFLDGPAGFVYSFVMAFHSFLVRSKTLTLYD
jgi:glycosyltransferase involved in cell wall biosynthesis